jgi:hypothetical protein
MDELQQAEEFYRIFDLTAEDLIPVKNQFKLYEKEAKPNQNKEEFALMYMVNSILMHNDRLLKRMYKGESDITGEDLYVIMIQNIFKLYLILKEFKQEDKRYEKVYKRVENILKACYFIEEGILIKLNLRLEPMYPKDSLEVAQAKLRKNDFVRREFKEYIFTTFRDTISEIIDRNLVIYYAEKIYWNIHCFQAPPRLDSKLALQDSMGTSDHYQEMIREILLELGVRNEEVNTN